MKSVRFTRLAKMQTPEAMKRAADAAAERKKRRQKMLAAIDIRNLDIFGYEPDCELSY